MRTRFAAASTVAMLLCSVGFVVLIFVGSHSYIVIPSRYGLCLVPALAACLAVASRRRAGGYALALGVVALLALLVQTLYPGTWPRCPQATGALAASRPRPARPDPRVRRYCQRARAASLAGRCPRAGGRSRAGAAGSGRGWAGPRLR